MFFVVVVLRRKKIDFSWKYSKSEQDILKNTPQHYIWTIVTVLYDDLLLDADVLLDFLVKDLVLLELVQEHLVLANIATI